MVVTASMPRFQGGVLDHHLHRLTIKCLPGDIPEHVEIDVTALGVGDAIHVSDLSVPKVEMQHDGDVSIVSILQARVEEAPSVPAEGEPEVIKKGKADEAEAEAGA